jgi:hypothetical protein
MGKIILLRDIAHARSGDKGSDVNIGVIGKSQNDFQIIEKFLTSNLIQQFFSVVCTKEVLRYSLPNLLALNFILQGALGEGGSSSLRSDAQGKAFGEALLHLELKI